MPPSDKLIDDFDMDLGTVGSLCTCLRRGW